MSSSDNCLLSFLCLISLLLVSIGAAQLEINNQSTEYFEEYIKATISIEIGEQWFLRTGSKK